MVPINLLLIRSSLHSGSRRMEERISRRLDHRQRIPSLRPSTGLAVPFGKLFRGTILPRADVAEILRLYPSLKPEDVAAAIAYAAGLARERLVPTAA